MRKILCTAGIAGLLLTSAARSLPAARTSQTQSGNSQLPAAQAQPDSTANHADAYYYFMLGHLQELQFEEQFQTTGSTDLATNAIDSYKKALELEPNSPVIMERLAEVYAATQRIRDAVVEAQAVLQADPNNMDAHRLLAHIYVRTLGDVAAGEVQTANIQKAVDELQAILKLAPDDSDSALWLARLYGFENKPADAEKILRDVLQREPDNGQALEQLSQLMIDEGRPQEAITLLGTAADEYSSPDLEDLLGDAYSQAKQFDKAEVAYQKAVDMDPQDPGHRHGLADTLLTEKKYAQALEQYKKLTTLEPSTAQNYLRMAQLSSQLGKFNDAETSLMRAKQLEPGNLEILDNEAILYEDQGRYDDAVKVLTDALAGLQKATPNPNALAILYKQLGEAYRKQQKYPAALQAYADMAKQGDDAQRQAELGTIDTYRESRDLNQAIAEAKKALAGSPNDADLTGALADLYGAQGDSAQGTKLLQGLLQGNDGDQAIYLEIAQVQERSKKYADAEQSAEKADQMAQSPSQKQFAWYVLGGIYERQKKYDQAEEQFKKVLGADPDNAATLNYYGYMLADRGIRLDEATNMIRKAVNIEPNEAAYLDSLGWAYYKQNKFTQAEEYLRRAIALDTNDPTILSHLGDVYMKLGQNEQAEQMLAKSLSEWQKQLPVDYEADKANEVDAQLKAVKRRLAQKSSAEPGKTQ